MNVPEQPTPFATAKELRTRLVEAVLFEQEVVTLNGKPIKHIMLHKGCITLRERQGWYGTGFRADEEVQYIGDNTYVLQSGFSRVEKLVIKFA